MPENTHDHELEIHDDSELDDPVCHKCGAPATVFVTDCELEAQPTLGYCDSCHAQELEALDGELELAEARGEFDGLCRVCGEHAWDFGLCEECYQRSLSSEL